MRGVGRCATDHFGCEDLHVYGTAFMSLETQIDRLDDNTINEALQSSIIQIPGVTSITMEKVFTLISVDYSQRRR